MISLRTVLTESLLDDESTIAGEMDMAIKEQVIIDWLKKYKIRKYQLSEDGIITPFMDVTLDFRYVVDSLPDYITFGETAYEFYVNTSPNCRLRTLRGLPPKAPVLCICGTTVENLDELSGGEYKELTIIDAPNLNNVDDAPVTKSFRLRNCPSLHNIKKINRNIERFVSTECPIQDINFISDCKHLLNIKVTHSDITNIDALKSDNLDNADFSDNPGLTSIKCRVKYCTGFNCDRTGITTLEGGPIKCCSFSCVGCKKLKSLDGLPSGVESLACRGCAVPFPLDVKTASRHSATSEYDDRIHAARKVDRRETFDNLKNSIKQKLHI